MRNQTACYASRLISFSLFPLSENKIPRLDQTIFFRFPISTIYCWEFCRTNVADENGLKKYWPGVCWEIRQIELLITLMVFSFRCQLPLDYKGIWNSLCS